MGLQTVCRHWRASHTGGVFGGLRGPAALVRRLLSDVSVITPAPEAVPSQRVVSVAIVGRPNVGKSTLFNRLCGTASAIVSEIPGTTRDRKMSRGYLAGVPMDLVDTGGIDDRGAVTIDIKKQVDSSLLSADVVLFLVDARSGITGVDESIAKWIRKKKGLMNKADADKDIDIVVVANKTEGGVLSDKVLMTVDDALRFGLGDPVLISATHGDGLADLADVLIETVKKRGYALDKVDKTNESEMTLEERTIQLAIMGRPNVGKSTLLNGFVGSDRVITGPTAGLTRDSIAVEWEFRERKFRLVDTAGLSRVRTDQRLLQGEADKRKHKIFNTLGIKVGKTNKSAKSGIAVVLPGIHDMDPESDPSQFSTKVSELALVSALNALKYAQVVLLVVEGSQGNFSKVDLKLAHKCLQEGRGLVIAANKLDIVALGDVSPVQYEEGVREHCESFMREFGRVPIVACSGTDPRRTGLDKLLHTVVRTHDAWSRRISTWVLNRWLRDTLVVHPPPHVGSRSVTVKYITQVKSRPPSFTLFCNTSDLPRFFERFLRNKLQSDFKLEGVPIRMTVRKTKGTEVNKKLLRLGKHTRRGAGRGEGRRSVTKAKRIQDSHIQRHKKTQDTRRRRDSRLRSKFKR
jgi:GTP-binding protein